MTDKKNTQDDDLTQDNSVCHSRREFLVAAKKWSKAVVAGAMFGGIILQGDDANAGRAWANRRSGGGRAWGNGGGGAWRNGGGGAWRNGGGGAWRNGGGGAWRNGSGGAWRNGGRSWANRN